jgi:sensor histidine kinase regulating citrate/malate metabolism
VLDNISDALVACDADGALTLCNSAAQWLHGLLSAAVPTEQWPLHYDLCKQNLRCGTLAAW